MIQLPGISPEAFNYMLVYGVGFITWTCAMARLVLEAFVNVRRRFGDEHFLTAAAAAPALPALALAVYFYLVAMLAAASGWLPEDFPNVVAAWAPALLEYSDAALGIQQETPVSLSWLAAAALSHGCAEVLLWLTGVPRRRRERQRYEGALESVLNPPKPAKAAERTIARFTKH